MNQTTTEITTQTLEAPGATLTYDVRPVEIGRASCRERV